MPSQMDQNDGHGKTEVPVPSAADGKPILYSDKDSPQKPRRNTERIDTK